MDHQGFSLQLLIYLKRQCWGGLLWRTVWLVETPANISAMRHSPRFSQKSGELLLWKSRRPSHREIMSQRNNGAPSRISNRTSPWWFTWQTCSSIAVVLLDTDQYHAMKTPLIEIALSQFIKADQTNHMSHKLSESLHKLGQCQKLLTTKSDLTI